MQGGKLSYSPSLCQIDSQGVAIEDVKKVRIDALFNVKFCNPENNLEPLNQQSPDMPVHSLACRGSNPQSDAIAP